MVIVAFTATETAVTLLQESINAELPPGRTLTQATTEAHEDMGNIKNVHHNLVEMNKAAAELLSDIVSAGLEGSAQIQVKLNELAAAVVRSAKQQRLEDLEDVADEL